MQTSSDIARDGATGRNASLVGAPEPALAAWIRDARRSVLRQMVELVARPGVVSMAGGLPAPELFPRAELASAYERVLGREVKALQYLPPFMPLKEQIQDLMRARGVVCDLDQIVLTTGAQQALDVLARLLVDRGTTVIAEAQAYTGIHQVVAPRGARIRTVGADLDHGIDPEAVEARLGEGDARMIYTVPEGHNPLGVTLAPERRRRLVEVAARHGVPIVEDDPYGFLAYDGAAQPALAAADEVSEGGGVVYVGSFSKILGPALRLGWMVLPKPLVARASIIKEGMDLECSSLTQRVVSELLADREFFASHLRRLRDTYRERRDAVLGELRQVALEGASWSRPSSGMFVYLRFAPDAVPEGFETRSLLQRALDEEQLAFIPGSAFDCVPGAGGDLGLRLSFSLLEPEALRDAVRRLARSVASHRQALSVADG
ncbi:MAG: PLP-dependent aminotransferase family protein [Acidobacteria bacterium]|nr:MAG: PLP-dependent aminotransferase family protein [Acidobacteriota bacterium]REK00292.1 MAG: PLP-dependent aminotransferase family protein [Acidobacteriota bacterium]